MHGIAVRDGYGQTETGAVAGVLRRRGAGAGIAGPAAARRRASTIADGELCVVASTLPTLFIGYLDDREATGRSLQNGLWHTGDLVRQDAEGRLWYEGRRDDVISSSGYRIGPGEVESALRSHPAVAEAAAVGLPDRDRGQIVHADVVLAPGAVPSDELRRPAARRTSARRRRRTSTRGRCGSCDELPRTSTGKVRRAAIRADLARG